MHNWFNFQEHVSNHIITTLKMLEFFPLSLVICCLTFVVE